MVVTMIIAITMMLTPSASPSPAPTPTALGGPMWFGVQAGEDIVDAAKTLGEPLMKQPFSGSIIWWYPTNNDRAFLSVEENAGHIATISVLSLDHTPSQTDIVDPNGIRLGGSGKQLTPLAHNIGEMDAPGYIFQMYDAGDLYIWGYDISRDDAIFSISLSSPVIPTAAPISVSDAVPNNGSSASEPYLINAHSKQQSETLEVLALTDVPGGCDRAWQIITLTVLKVANRTIHQMDLSCPTGKYTTTVYFDITNVL